jgi:transcriptional regulator with XRE-family HTH domain
MNAKEEFGARLRAAMKAVGIGGATELGHAFNRRWGKNPVSVQAVSLWINGKAMPRNERLQVLAKVLRVDPLALMFGAPETMSAADRRRGWEERMSYAERESIEAFLRLPTKQRLIVRDVIATYAHVFGAVDPSKE